MRRIPYEKLKQYCESVFAACGVPQTDAELVTDCLLYANLSGVDSHGIVRLAHYVARLQNRTIVADARVSFETPRPTIVRVDGGDGLGHVITSKAVKRGIEVCREQGVAAITIGGSSHFGMAGYYLKAITEAGMVGMVTTHTDVMIVPTGARKRFAGTNPIAYGFPTGGEPLVLDFATSKVAFGKVAIARVENHPIPGDWGVDANGEPTTDPHALSGLHPVAGHKGSGLAMVIDLFSSIFSGMPYGPHINRMYEEMDASRKLGHFVTLWDVDALFPLADVRARLDQYIQELHALPRVDPDQPIYYPGELEAIRRKERLESGIPIGEGLIEELAEVGSSLGVNTELFG